MGDSLCHLARIDVQTCLIALYYKVTNPIPYVTNEVLSQRHFSVRYHGGKIYLCKKNCKGFSFHELSIFLDFALFTTDMSNFDGKIN